MKDLIKKILKEGRNEKIIDHLSQKFDYNDFFKIKYYLLHKLGYTEDEIFNVISTWFEMESGLELTPLNWMNDNYSLDQLEVVKHSGHPNSIFFKKNGKIVMEQDKNATMVLFDYDKIWKFFENSFGLKYNEIESILTKWLEETLKLKGYTASTSFTNYTVIRWKKLSN